MRIVTAMVIITSLGSAPVFAQNGSGSNIAGTWIVEDGSLTVAIAPCGTNQCGTVVREKPQPGEPSLVGQTVIRDIKVKDQKNWVGNYVLGGKVYRANIKQSSINAISLKVCALAFLCQSLRLSRVK